MKEAFFYTKCGNDNVHCNLCSHNCLLTSGNFGKCGARKNVSGILTTLTYGHLVAQNIDPIEKKPLYHFFPGSKTYSIAAPGCNFTCSFCQNWEISQLKRRNAEFFSEKSKSVLPEEIVEAAIISGCKSIAFTYTEPTVFYEYMKDVSQIAKSRGVRLVVVSNGFMSEKVIDDLKDYIDAYNIDLKAFSDSFYMKICGARLEPVLNSIKNIKKSGSWLEVTTLIIPGENDSVEELNNIASFLAENGNDIPWHISRFFPQYKFNNYPSTPEKTLEKAIECGIRNGLKYIYAGNVSYTNVTSCSVCKKALITRNGYVTNSMMIKPGICPNCESRVEGVWE